MKKMSEYRELGMLYLSKIANIRFLLFKIPKILLTIMIFGTIFIALLDFVDGKQSLQRWEQNQIERKVYLICSTREESRYKGAFIPIGSTASESVVEAKTKKAITEFNNDVIEYREKRKSGEIAKSRYSREQEASAFWAENPNGDYGILINWEDTTFPEGYIVKSIIIQGK